MSDRRDPPAVAGDGGGGVVVAVFARGGHGGNGRKVSKDSGHGSDENDRRGKVRRTNHVGQRHRRVAAAAPAKLPGRPPGGFVLPVISVEPPPSPSPSASSASSGSSTSFGRPDNRAELISRLPPPRSRPPPSLGGAGKQPRPKRSSSWSCGSDCGSDHGEKEEASLRAAAASGGGAKKKKALHKRSMSSTALSSAAGRHDSTDEDEGAADVGPRDEVEEAARASDGGGSSSGSARDSGIATAGATSQEGGTLAERSAAAVPLGDRRAGFSKDIVSLLIIDGCKECEARLGITEEDYVLGRKEHYPLHVYATGDRVRRTNIGLPD